MKFADLKISDEIHLIGATGLEMAFCAHYLFQQGYRNLVLHDLAADYKKSFFHAHQFIPSAERNKRWQVLENIGFSKNTGYAGQKLQAARALFLPQSWYLHGQNTVLTEYAQKFIFFPDLVFSAFPGRIAAVTGSVGKSTTCSLLSQLCDGLCWGNDRENSFSTDELSKAGKNSLMIFELSNRHLKNGFSSQIEVGAITALTPNHLGEHDTLDDYYDLKLSLKKVSDKFVLPFKWKGRNRGKTENYVTFGNDPGADFRIGSGHIYKDDIVFECCNRQYLPADSCAAALATAYALGVDLNVLEQKFKHIGQTKLYRAQNISSAGRRFINDAASCVPESTKCLVEMIHEPFFLITGGSRQKLTDDEFSSLADALGNNSFLQGVFVSGEHAGKMAKAFLEAGLKAVIQVSGLVEAFDKAVRMAEILVVYSPGGGSGTEFADKYERGSVFEKLVMNLG